MHASMASELNYMCLYSLHLNRKVMNPKIVTEFGTSHEFGTECMTQNLAQT